MFEFVRDHNIRGQRKEGNGKLYYLSILALKSAKITIAMKHSVWEERVSKDFFKQRQNLYS